MDEPTNFQLSESPFMQPLESVGEGRLASFHNLEKRPDLFIRRRDIDRVDAARTKYTSEAFETMRQYGINVPEYQVVIGSDEQGLAEYVIADKVQGISLEEALQSDPEIPTEIINNTFRGIVDYITNASANETVAYGDFRIDQFMVGHTARNLDEAIYMVDLDPGFRQPHGDTFGRIADIMTQVQQHVKIDESIWNVLKNTILAHDKIRLPSDEYTKVVALLEATMPQKS